MINNYPPSSRKENLVTQEFANETLIYDLQKNKALCLNETSAIIWQLCDGNKSVEQISREASDKLDLPVSKELVWLALDQLKRQNLLKQSEITENEFNTVSRRELVKKIGLSSMAALPVIVSIVAPTAVNAQSCVGLVAPSGTVGPVTYPDLNTGTPNAGDTCVARLTAQCCSMTGNGGCSCNINSCIGSVTCS